MTVKELIEVLQTMPQDQEVVLACDSEGNDFSFLALESTEWYQPINQWHGDLCGPQEEERPNGCIPVVVLWPTN